MITVFQYKDFLTDRRIKPKYLGSFYSIESAEEKLGWYFIHHCCLLERF